MICSKNTRITTPWDWPCIHIKIDGYYTMGEYEK